MRAVWVRPPRQEATILTGNTTGSLGATSEGDSQYRFLVWAPFPSKVDLHLLGPDERLVPMRRNHSGYHEIILQGIEPGNRYYYRLDETYDRPDPASRFQPLGVHGPTEVIDPDFEWTDDRWQGLDLADYVFYELHVGTFSPKGTLEAIVPFLGELKGLGVNAIELMPLAQFPGTRNWGYDGVHLFAVQNSYGGPQALKRLVDACHGHQMAVVLDVVYNHLGPEGNYLGQFAPYFTERYRTPWGQAVNFDGPDSDEVRRFFIENALYWVQECHIDALRLDAVHAILDHSAVPFLQDLGLHVRSLAGTLNRKIHVIPESALNDTRLLRPLEQGGFALDAQWNDDFHHSLRTLLTGDRTGYYQDFGMLEHLMKAYREGYVYSGQHSFYRRRRHGNDSSLIPARQFVVFAQNHDQVGNRRQGERLGRVVGFEGLKLAAGAVILSPFLPLLFMGEEYDETAPFLYFVSHSDERLIEAVRRGRKEEFASFAWEGDPPDPQDESSFLSSKLNRSLRLEAGHRELWEFYRELLRLRRHSPALALLSKDHVEVTGDESNKTIRIRRWCEGQEMCLWMNFQCAGAHTQLILPPGRWAKILDSSDPRWLGPGSAFPGEWNRGEPLDFDASPFQLVLLERT
jgi:maltooligosyltrehalose trehalohydrolase